MIHAKSALAIAALVGLACARAWANTDVQDATDSADPLAGILRSETAIANGKLRFAQNCNYCHGADGTGGKHRKLQCRNFDPEYVFDTVTNGLESGSYFMPPWDHFSEEKRWELVAFIKSLDALDSCG